MAAGKGDVKNDASKTTGAMSSAVRSRKPGALPVTLLTGFLGSGKTTVLNHLLRRPELANAAVLINEFGEIPLDQDFIDYRDDSVVVLANGCLCCIGSGDFEASLNQLFARADERGAPDFDRLLIETTGVADPAPTMQLLLGNPIYSSIYRLDGVACTVDAMHCTGQLERHAEATRQIALADDLLLTKTDIAPPDTVDAAIGRLRRINPTATLRTVTNGEVEPDELFNEHRTSRAGLIGADAPGIAGDGHDLSHRGHGHDSDIETFSFEHDEPVEWDRFQYWLRRLRVEHGEQLLRVKGMIDVQGEDGPIVIHGVQHVFHPPIRGRDWPTESRRSRLVFIVQGLPRAEIEASWRRNYLKQSAASG